LTVTDQTVLAEIQRALVETVDSGATWSSGHWTADEVIDYLNQRQSDFLKRTQILLKRDTSINTIPHNTRHALPSDTISLHRVVWRDDSGVYTPLPRSDSFDQDHADGDWPIDPRAKPDIYTDGEVPNLLLQTSPPASSPGVLEILYAFVGTALSNSGVNFTVPDMFVQAIKWGVVADMLSKVGRGQDLQRAKWAEVRYEMGAEAAALILNGWY